MRRTTLMIGRIISLCLAFVLGFFSAFGAIAGGIYYAYSKVSLDKLNEWAAMFGYGIPLDEFVDQEAETPATSLTLQDLFAEIQQVQSDKLTLEEMIEKYGLVLPQDIVDSMPAPVMNEIPFALLFSEEGMQLMMDKVTVADIVAMIPEDISASLNSEPARQAFSNNTLSEVVEKDIGYIFEGVQLGYITGVTYVLDENGVYQPVWADPADPTLVEIIAPLDLGRILSAVASGEGNVLEVIENSIGDVAINSILGTFMADMVMLSNLLGEATLGDLIVVDSATGEYAIDIMKAMDGRKVGSLLGYTEQENTDPETLEVEYNWIDAEGNNVKGISAKFADIYIADFMNGTVSVDSLMEDLIIADVLGYEKGEKLPVFIYDNFENQVILEKDIDVWYSNGAPADKLMNSFANKTVTWLGSSVSTLQLADVLGYCMYNGEWYTWNVECVNGSDAIVLHPGSSIMSEIAGTPIGEMGNIESTIKDIQIGTLLGYESICDKNNVHLYWSTGTDENGNPVEASGITASIADLTINELADGDGLQTTINDVTIADVMGYTKNEEDGKWYKGNEVVTGPMASLADSKVGSLSSDMNSMSIGKMLGHTPIYVTDADNKQTLSHWEDSNGNRIEGIMAAFVDLSIEDMKDNQTITNAIQDIQVSDVMGLKYINDEWYNSDGVTKATGIMSAIAEVKIKDLSTEMQNITIGEMLGLYEKDGVWYNSDDSEASNVIAALADTSIENLNRDLNAIKVGELLGFTYNKDEQCWYDGDKKASGVTGVLADSDLTHLNTNLSTLLIGDVAGYVKLNANDENATDGEGWYKYDEATQSYVKATGVLASMADLTVDQLGEGNSMTDQIGTVKLAEALGYSKKDDIWYDKDNKPLEGIMAALAEEPLNNMNGAAKKLKISDVLPEKQSGLLSIIDTSKPIDEIDDVINDSIKDSPLQFFVNEQLITFDADTISTLDSLSKAKGGEELTVITPKMLETGYYDTWIKENSDLVNENGEHLIPTWRTKPLANSFDYIVKLLNSSIPSIPNV